VLSRAAPGSRLFVKVPAAAVRHAQVVARHCCKRLGSGARQGFIRVLCDIPPRVGDQVVIGLPENAVLSRRRFLCISCLWWDFSVPPFWPTAQAWLNLDYSVLLFSVWLRGLWAYAFMPGNNAVTRICSHGILRILPSSGIAKQRDSAGDALRPSTFIMEIKCTCCQRNAGW